MDQETNTQPVIPTSPMNSQPTNKKSGILKKVAIALVLIVGGFVALIAFALSSAKGASDAAVGVIDNLQAGECQVIYDTQASNGFKSATTNEEWNEGCSRIGAILQGDAEKQSGVNISAETGEATQSDVEFVITGTDEKIYDVKLEMVKEDDSWKMLSLDSVPQGEVNAAE